MRKKNTGGEQCGVTPRGRARNRHTGRVIATVVVLMMLILGPAKLPSATQAETLAIAARVSGAPSVNVRSCPRIDCDIVVAINKGAEIVITGETVDGFVPVRAAGKTGYAFELYLRPSGGPAPFFFQGERGCQRIALIFNIGVGFDFDRGILDTLDQWNVPATMFPMGWWAEKNPDLMREMVDRGYPIGHHGDMPLDLVKASDEKALADLRSADRKIRAIIGDELGPWFTPYAASMDERVRSMVAAEGYLPVGWKVPAADYGRNATAEQVWERVVPRAYDGAIVEFHIDAPVSATSTGVALPWIIDGLTQRGYTFVTIPELTMPCAAGEAAGLPPAPAATPAVGTPEAGR